MGASTTQGTGHGAVGVANKGPGNARNQYVPIAGPHVVAAGTATLPAVASMEAGQTLIGDHTAELYVVLQQALPEGPENYVVMLTPQGEHGGYGHADIQCEVYAKWGTTTFPVFHIVAYGGAARNMSSVAGRKIDWMIVRTGYSKDITS